MTIQGISPALELRMQKRITSFEQRCKHVYLDSKKHPSIAIGFNLDRPDARMRMTSLGLDYDRIRSGEQTMNDHQIDTLFEQTFRGAVVGARADVRTFDRLAEDARVVLVDMAFNMGGHGLAGFHKMIGALELLPPDYLLAAAELTDSDYARTDVPARAMANKVLMLGCAKANHAPPIA